MYYSTIVSLLQENIVKKNTKNLVIYLLILQKKLHRISLKFLIGLKKSKVYNMFRHMFDHVCCLQGIGG